MSCGDCTACCKALSIDEIDKPAGVMCTHCGKGCTIYDKRPDVCREFECAYLVGKWNNENLRPDNSGIILRPISETEYHALQFEDEVHEDMLKQLDFIESNYDVKIERLYIK